MEISFIPLSLLLVNVSRLISDKNLHMNLKTFFLMTSRFLFSSHIKGSFFIPMLVMVYVYLRISCVVANRHDDMVQIKVHQVNDLCLDLFLCHKFFGSIFCDGFSSKV